MFLDARTAKGRMLVIFSHNAVTLYMQIVASLPVVIFYVLDTIMMFGYDDYRYVCVSI